MTKAMRDMEEKRELCDGVICVLDARAPAATLNKNLKKVFGEKPILYLLNKADLADSGADGFLKLIEEKGRARRPRGSTVPSALWWRGFPIRARARSSIF